MAKKSFEENMARLEEIVALLEKGDAQLSQSLSLFEEGTKLAAACRTELDKAEQQVVRLMKGPDGAPSKMNLLARNKNGIQAAVCGLSAGHRGVSERHFHGGQAYGRLPRRPCVTAFWAAASASGRC